ncbi:MULTISPECIES: ABC transporter substrate-binding protein [unclassified Janthinobacterium]|uniref:ABC transporter substrate-binding protein n=1 Tax=unclassified Janthinobacterium TaxID=2610881 RepID=UPI000362DB33|nr:MULTISPECIES: ABC transporter substrate-binding protein [unclassified Janthinobacterium]MEC5162618.1 branched-chain amino acid transport system substrate-binding protein [Janthinobacterium sp. CG_S6]
MKKSISSGLYTFACATIAVVCAALAGPHGAAAAAEPIRIGSVVSATGPAAYLGDPELKTLQLYIERLNAEGGVLGRRLELVHYDDGSEANKAGSFAKRLIESDKVDLIIGGTTTGSSLAMIPLVEQAGMPFISMAAGVSIVEPVKKWVFKVAPTDRMAAEKVFTDMKRLGLLRIGLLSETSGFGQSGSTETQAVAPRFGITIVANETYAPRDTDVTAQLTKIKSAPGIQAVFVFGAGQGPAVATRNYQQLAIALPLYQSHGVASAEYIKLSGAAADGVKLPAAALVVAGQLAADDPQKAVVTAYEKTYRERYKASVSSFGGHGYDALMIAVAALKKAGGSDKNKVRDAIEETTGYIGTAGRVDMTPADHMGLNLTAFRLLDVKNGQWRLLR